MADWRDDDEEMESEEYGRLLTPEEQAALEAEILLRHPGADLARLVAWYPLYGVRHETGEPYWQDVLVFRDDHAISKET